MKTKITAIKHREDQVFVLVSRRAIKALRSLIKELEGETQDYDQLARRAVGFFKSHLHNQAVIQRLEDHITQENRKNAFTFNPR